MLGAELVLNGDGFEKHFELSLEDGRWSVTLRMPDEPGALWYSFRMTLAGGEYWLAQAKTARFGQLHELQGRRFPPHGLRQRLRDPRLVQEERHVPDLPPTASPAIGATRPGTE